MKFLFLTLFSSIMFLSSTNLLAQYSDSFDQGTLEQNGWTGDLENFVMNGMEELQLMDAMPGSNNLSVLSRSLTTGDSTSWEFMCKLEFSPSASNYSEIVLAMDAPQLTDGNGYVIRIGGISGDQDAIGLYKKTGNQYDLLVEGTAGAVGAEPALARVRVIRNAAFFWEMWVDYSGGTNFVLEGEAFDNSYPTGNYFAFSCIYTSTRADKFFFDDLIIGPEYIDAIPPKVAASSLTNEGNVQLSFSEPMEVGTTTNAANYSFTPNINFDAPNFIPGSTTEVEVNVTTPLVSGSSYALSITGLEDLFGNVINDTTIVFEYLEIQEAEAFDILINEIMADPSPPVGLPEYEYVEIWNRSTKNIQLDQLQFEDESGVFDLPSYVLVPNEYLVLTSTNSVELLQFPNTIGILGFPFLTNSDERIALVSKTGELIHRVEYDLSWYQDTDRDDGGYSLEMINPNRLCETITNWRASAADIGGTPGQINANFDESSSAGAPELLNALAINANTIDLQFSQALDEQYLGDFNTYSIDGFEIVSTAIANNGQSVVISISPDLVPNEVHTLSMSSPVVNCRQENSNAELSWPIGLPSAVEFGDIVINEILFNPRTGGKDYFELYNLSDKILNIGEWFVATEDEEGNLSSVEAFPQGAYLFPKSYMAFSEDPFNVAAEYPDENRPGQILELDLPTLADNEGTLIIYTGDALDVNVLDRFDYLDDYHNPLLADKDGVSLERLSFSIPTNTEENWSSAAGTAGFGTPAAPNSQQLFTGQSNSEDPFDFGVARLSPDDDGFEDFLPITYQDQSGNFSVSLRIYSASGQLVKVLANNKTVGTEALFTWNGDLSNGEKAPVGLYIAWAERFNPDGIVERFKKSIVVAAYLN